MWERFTERSKLVVKRARDEAVRLNSDNIGTQHLLWALCREPDGIAAQALGNLGVDIEGLASAIEHQARSGVANVSVDDIGFSNQARIVLEDAVDVARHLNHSYIGTEHILLSICNAKINPTIRNLHEFRLDPNRLRAEVKRLLGSPELFQSEGQQTSSQFRELKPGTFFIDPGSATSEDLAELFHEISKLYEMLGGAGIRFEILDCLQPEFEAIL